MGGGFTSSLFYVYEVKLMLTKCSLCSRVATVGVEEYNTVADTYGASVPYCDGHMFNTITDGVKVYRITQKVIAKEKYVVAGTNGYIK